MRGETNQFGVPARRNWIAAPHALTQLHQRMLDVARMLFVVEEFGDLFIGELAAEPSVPPEQKGHEDDQPGREENEETAARGHFVMRRGGSLRWGVFCDDFRRIAGLRSERWTGHGYCGSLTLVGGWGWFSRLRSFAFSKEALITEFPEHVQEENPGDAQHDQDFEEAVHGGHRSGVDDPANPRERNEAEHNRNQEHYGAHSPPQEDGRLCPVPSSP